MKIPRHLRSTTLARGTAAFVLTCALAFGGAAVPLTASAEASAATAPASADASASAPSTSSVATIAVAPVVLPVTPPAKQAPAKKLTVRQIITKTAIAAHLSKTEIATLMWIAKRESNFHPRSESRSECHGLFQLSAGMAHGHPWRGPAWNTKRAIKYMRGRYGSVLRAKSFWLSHHWY